MGIVSLILVFLIFSKEANSEELASKMGLIQFMEKLSPGNNSDPSFGWTAETDPCTHKWKGVTCDSNSQFVKKIVLERLNLTGILDADTLCNATSSTLFVLSLKNNNVGGIVPAHISNCRKLTHLFLGNNLFSGKLPETLPVLNNLKRLDLSNNAFTGEIPDVSRISGLKSFLGQNNRFNGQIPRFDFSNLEEFNVSNNNLTGLIPNMNGNFTEDSFLGNPGLCGNPLPNRPCPTQVPTSGRKGRKWDSSILIYSGYGIIGLVLVCLLVYKLVKLVKRKEKERTHQKNEKISSTISSEYSLTATTTTTSGDTSRSRSSLMVISTPFVNRLSFEELLSSPAELVSRSDGSLYKVTVGGGGITAVFAVKRIKSLSSSKEEFKRRMVMIDGCKHPNVLPVVAYYCSNQEKLFVYEFLPKGSLFNLLQGSQTGQFFKWEEVLNVVQKVAKALVFMHERLPFGHGNLKSSNIVFNKNLSPCLSEYGFQTEVSRVDNNTDFKEDVFGFGVILVELVTGRVVERKVENAHLVKWVESVVEKEEWSGDHVFDGAIVYEGTSKETMVSLLQVALQCINVVPQARPTMSHVLSIIEQLN